MVGSAGVSLILMMMMKISFFRILNDDSKKYTANYY
jgi:hypothetical protein